MSVSVTKKNFQGLIGAQTDPDQAVCDRYVPHPVYARQRWISIVNPSDATVHASLLPLIAESHHRLVATHERRRPR